MTHENELINQNLSVINLGINDFIKPLLLSGANVTNIQWEPPAEGNSELGRKLAKLTYTEKWSKKIDEANEKAVKNIISSQPLLIDLKPAREALGLDQHTFLHAGPPISYNDMCGPMQGAAIGAMIFEGLADSPETAIKKLKANEIRFEPCHHHSAVGPMAGLISPSMWLFEVKDNTFGNIVYSNIMEGPPKTLHFGVYDEFVINRLRWMAKVLAPTLKKVISETGPIDLREIIAQAIHMGDDCHNRNFAATLILFRQLVTRMIKLKLEIKVIREITDFIAGINFFFLNLSMAACKAMLDSALEIPFSSIVTAMCRNGVEFGIRVSGTGDQWFTAPANPPKGVYFPGYSEKEAALDMGDSAITETAGIGGFVMGNAPAIAGSAGGSAKDAAINTENMGKITIGRNPNFTLPFFDFEGAPVGIDTRLVLETGICPIINTGIAHKNPNVGQVGAGIVTAPMGCFKKAINALFESFK